MISSSSPFSQNLDLLFSICFYIQCGEAHNPWMEDAYINAFIESLTSEHDKIVQMGIIRYSYDQALHVSWPKDMNGKGKQQKNPKTKFDAPKPRVENQQHDESFGSKKNKGKGNHGKEKVKCSYCGKGFHLENDCMKKKLDEATSLLERNHINILERF